MLRDPEQVMDLRKPELKLSCPEAEGEDGLELSLGLSHGGSYSKSLRRSYSEIGSSKANDVGSRPPLMNGLCSGGTPQWRRELHALRRQEAPRKRQRKAAAINGRVRSARTCTLDEKTLLEAKEVQSQCRAKDREGRERDPTPAEWRRSRCKTPENVHSSNPNVTTTSLGPAVPLECTAYQKVQYVPVTNGFGFPYMMPCWAPAVSPSGNGTGCMEVNIFQPVACRGFALFPVPAASSNGSGWKIPGGEVVDTKPARSSSTGSSPSSISDSQSGSPHGSCNSNDCRSNPNQTLDKIPRRQSSSEIINPQVHSSCSTSCNEMPSSSHVIKEDAEKPVLSSTQASLGSNLMGTASPVSRKRKRATSVNKPISKGAVESQDEPSLPRIPCVYTTGNGPNGKTITGFLYKYSTSEVCIACVCHGISFSPAEFVKHAGGINVSNPLRQIIVVP